MQRRKTINNLFTLSILIWFAYLNSALEAMHSDTCPHANRIHFSMQGDTGGLPQGSIKNDSDTRKQTSHGHECFACLYLFAIQGGISHCYDILLYLDIISPNIILLQDNAAQVLLSENAPRAPPSCLC